MHAVLSEEYIAVYAGLETPQQSLTSSPAARVCCLKAPVLREDAPVWFQHAPELCGMLEAFDRATARSLASGTCSPVLQKQAELCDVVVALIDPTQPGLQGPVLQAAAAEGPGSKEQQQLHGLLRSVIKWAGVMGPDQQPLAEQLRAAVAVAAANLLLAGSRAQEAGAAAAAVAAASSTATADDIASSSAAVSSRHGQDGSTEQPAQHSIAQHVQVATSPGPKATSSSAAVLSHLPWLGVAACSGASSLPACQQTIMRQQLRQLSRGYRTAQRAS